MARDDKTPATRTRRVRSRDDSLLLRSAESLGRVIGRLQRQLDVLTRKVSRGSGVATPGGESPAARGKSNARTRTSTARAHASARRSSRTARTKTSRTASTKAPRSRKGAAAARGGKKKTRR